MIADATAVRRALADRLAATLREPSGTILLGGSVALGRADRDSDLDLLVVCPTIPTAAWRAAWLAAQADAGSAWYHDLPVRTGGCADTLRVGGIDVTVTWRRGQQVEQQLEPLLAGQADADHEVAYGHELGAAVVLWDPAGTAALWRRRLAAGAPRRELPPPADRPTDPATAAWSVYPTAVACLRAACWARGCWYPGPKQVAAALAGEPRLSNVVEALCAAADPWQRLAAIGWSCLPPRPTPAAVPAEQLLAVALDALGERHRTAARRGQPIVLAHYLHRSLDAWLRLGAPPTPYVAALRPGSDPARQAAVHRELVGLWLDWLPTAALTAAQGRSVGQAWQALRGVTAA
ncbi:MAG: nucleotidyltransferase domain-containing protein [Fimbriimonadaceae bacterium]|nr:nucleotidyltransferase domain-containing protein [Fimbriimonadaceae bacterium]